MTRKRGRPKTGHTPRRSVRIPSGEWELLRLAAEVEGTDRAAFIRDHAGIAARKVLSRKLASQEKGA